MSVRRSWQDHSFEQLRCLVFGFQIVLYRLDVGVSFATLLLRLGLNSDRSPAPGIRIEANQHRAQSLLLQRKSLAPAARAERRLTIEGVRQRQQTYFGKASNPNEVRPLSSMHVASTDQWSA